MAMPKLWNDTIEAHRQTVRDAILDTAASLVAEHGVAGVTMTQLAKETGLGRATLYKYFPDVAAVLAGWHERQVRSHLEQLAAIGNESGGGRLEAVLQAYAFISHEHPSGDLAVSLHRAEHVAEARGQLANFVTQLVVEGVAAGEVRDDVPARELAAYSLHALTAASALPSKAAVRRLVAVTLAGLQKSS